jgi:uncharacterized protein
MCRSDSGGYCALPVTTPVDRTQPPSRPDAAVGTTPTVPAPRLAPTEPAGRIVTIDALRGAALLGILLVNVQNIMGPPSVKATWRGTDLVLQFLITWLVEGKFISMFALLFGLGIALQIARARRRGRPFAAFLLRRFAVLAVFGAMHGIAVWSGDVLLSYAVTGCLLLLFASRDVRSLRRWSLGLWLAISAVLLGGVAVIAAAGGPSGTGGDLAADVYRSGDYGAMVGQRLRELAGLMTVAVVALPWTLALMLAGMVAVRSGIATDVAGHRPQLRRLAVAGIACGLPLGLVGAIVAVWGGATVATRETYSLAILHAGGPVLGIGYLSAGALLIERHLRSAATRRLAAVGRMALTNYLLQSVFTTAWYYSGDRYGAGSLTAGLGLWLVLSVLQLLWSPWWLDRFAQGPMEALWRRLTYRARPGQRSSSSVRTRPPA